MTDVETAASHLFAHFPRLLQFQLEGPGLHMIVWLSIDILYDATDPSSWQSRDSMLEDLDDGTMKSALTKFYEAIDEESELPAGYLPHVWHRPLPGEKLEPIGVEIAVDLVDLDPLTLTR